LNGLCCFAVAGVIVLEFLLAGAGAGTVLAGGS
jgi:hypothetical protein